MQKQTSLNSEKSTLAHSLPAYNAIVLYYITFYSTLSPIVIVSHLKVPSLQIFHTEHYRVNLCRTETISFLVITFPALENKRSLATDVAGILPAAVWRLLLLTDTFGGSSPTRTVDFGCAKVSARRGKLSAVYTWSVAMRRRQWQTTPIQHCWTLRHSVCPTGSTPVWGRQHQQMQWMTAVRRRCLQQPPTNDMWQQVAKSVNNRPAWPPCVYVLLKTDVTLYFHQ